MLNSRFFICFELFAFVCLNHIIIASDRLRQCGLFAQISLIII